MDQQQTSLSQCDDDSNQYRFISHVDFIRMLRDTYKEQTQSNLNELKAQVEQECERETQKAEKGLTLLNHCRDTLQQLDIQRKSIEHKLGQHAAQAKLFSEQLRQEKCLRFEALNANERAISHLLSELRENSA